MLSFAFISELAMRIDPFNGTLIDPFKGTRIGSLKNPWVLIGVSGTAQIASGHYSSNERVLQQRISGCRYVGAKHPSISSHGP